MFVIFHKKKNNQILNFKTLNFWENNICIILNTCKMVT